MGLDQYLYKKTYFYKKDNIEIKINNKVIDTTDLTSITEEVGYWRKANHIHNWFVNNVQEGEDDCRDYEVSLEKLKELESILRVVDIQRDKAAELLPSTSGFFFGSTEYDEYYFNEVSRTIKILENIISELESENTDTYISIEYSSSW